MAFTSPTMIANSSETKMSGSDRALDRPRHVENRPAAETEAPGIHRITVAQPLPIFRHVAARSARTAGARHHKDVTIDNLFCRLALFTQFPGSRLTKLPTLK